MARSMLPQAASRARRRRMALGSTTACARPLRSGRRRLHRYPPDRIGPWCQEVPDQAPDFWRLEPALLQEAARDSLNRRPMVPNEALGLSSRVPHCELFFFWPQLLSVSEESQACSCLLIITGGLFFGS